MKLDNKMKRLLREMGEAINDSLSASEDLTGTIDRIRQEGYDIFLILEATIGINPRSGEEDGQAASRTLPATSIEITEGGKGVEGAPPRIDGENEIVFQVSPDDEQFLRSLRISVDDSGAGLTDSDAEGPGTESGEDGDDEEE